jgi:hypothetical protein
VEWYQPGAAKWVDFPLTPVEKRKQLGYQGGRSCYGDGCLFIFGLTEEKQYTLDRYHLKKQEWSSLPQPLDPHLPETMHFVDNKLYLFGELHNKVFSRSSLRFQNWRMVKNCSSGMGISIAHGDLCPWRENLLARWNEDSSQ